MTPDPRQQRLLPRRRSRRPVHGRPQSSPPGRRLLRLSSMHLHRTDRWLPVLMPLTEAAPLMTAIELIHPIRTFRVTPDRSDDVESLIDRIGRFLPANFIALADPAGDHALVAGFDHAGWSRNAYVLPRLASGLIFPTEPGDAENRYDIVLNLFHEGYQAMADDLDDDDFPSDAFEGRLDCISFVLTHFALAGPGQPGTGLPTRRGLLPHPQPSWSGLLGPWLRRRR